MTPQQANDLARDADIAEYAAAFGRPFWNAQELAEMPEDYSQGNFRSSGMHYIQETIKH